MINFSKEKIAGSKVMLTGGAGFIGSILCKTLLGLCDILDEKLCRNEGVSAKFITYINDRPAHHKRYTIDAKIISIDLGWKPSVTFEAGLGKKINWYLDNGKCFKNLTSGKYLM